MNLMRTGMWNSVILSVFFALSTINDFVNNNYLWSIIGVFATVATINDTINFYKENK